MSLRVSVPALAAALFLTRSAGASEPRSLTIEQAVNEAIANHPRIRGGVADEAVSAARVTEAESNKLPDLGISAQLNRSSSNTVPGAFVPIQGFAPISGATRGKTLETGTWQSGASLWASWDALSFARQAAAVDVALAAKSEAKEATAARRLDVAYRAADAFLLLLEADAALRAAKASVDRADVLATVTTSLVDQALRPGADAARSDAELANARTMVARAEQARDLRQAALGEALGDPSLVVAPLPGELLARGDAPPTPGTVPPELRQSEAAVARASEAERLVRVEYLPRLDVIAALWVRGSGIFGSPADGLVTDVPNWLAGATLTWSVLEFPSIRARAKIAAATREAAVARRDEVALSIAGQLASARAMLRGAVGVAKQTPATLDSARTAEQQARARFKTGLSPVVDLADAQRLLAQAEIEDAVARLEVRRALLLIARATGDLGPFLHPAKSGAP